MHAEAFVVTAVHFAVSVLLVFMAGDIDAATPASILLFIIEGLPDVKALDVTTYGPFVGPWLVLGISVSLHDLGTELPGKR